MTAKMVMVVEDDPNIQRLVSANLEARGFETSTFASVAPALSYLEQRTPDLVVLDLLLPGVNGIELLRSIHEGTKVPVMIISGDAETATKLEALELGADDYLTKPFPIEELMARVRAILRRSSGWDFNGSLDIFDCGDVHVDLGRSEVTRLGMLVKLTPREWAVLRALAKYHDRVVTQRTLLQQAWGPEYGDEGDYIRTYISRLRKKLESKPPCTKCIFTEPGLGYRLVTAGGRAESGSHG